MSVTVEAEVTVDAGFADVSASVGVSAGAEWSFESTKTSSKGKETSKSDTTELG